MMAFLIGSCCGDKDEHASLHVTVTVTHCYVLIVHAVLRLTAVNFCRYDHTMSAGA